MTIIWRLVLLLLLALPAYSEDSAHFVTVWKVAGQTPGARKQVEPGSVVVLTVWSKARTKDWMKYIRDQSQIKKTAGREAVLKRNLQLVPKKPN